MPRVLIDQTGSSIGSIVNPLIVNNRVDFSTKVTLINAQSIANGATYESSEFVISANSRITFTWLNSVDADVSYQLYGKFTSGGLLSTYYSLGFGGQFNENGGPESSVRGYTEFSNLPFKYFKILATSGAVGTQDITVEYLPY